MSLAAYVAAKHPDLEPEAVERVLKTALGELWADALDRHGEMRRRGDTYLAAAYRRAASDLFEAQEG